MDDHDYFWSIKAVEKIKFSIFKNEYSTGEVCTYKFFPRAPFLLLFQNISANTFYALSLILSNNSFYFFALYDTNCQQYPALMEIIHQGWQIFKKDLTSRYDNVPDTDMMEDLANQ